MKRCFVLILLILLAMPVIATAHHMEWEAVTTNTDGSPVTDLAGYNAYKVAPGPRTKLNASPIIPLTYTPATHPVDGDAFVVTAVDTAGNESADSNTVTYGVAPGSPPSLIMMP